MKVSRFDASGVTKITVKGVDMLLLDPPEWIEEQGLSAFCPGKAIVNDPHDMACETGPYGFLTDAGLIIQHPMYGGATLGNRDDIVFGEKVEVEFED
jgi:hypothetical protein